MLKDEIKKKSIRKVHIKNPNQPLLTRKTRDISHKIEITSYKENKKIMKSNFKSIKY